MSILRFATRSLLRRRAYSALTVLLLGLGVGAVAAIFSLVDVAYLRPLPYPDENRVLWISSLQPGPNGSETAAGLTAAHIVLERQNNRSFESIEGAIPKNHTVVVGADPEPADGLQVSAGLFGLLGAKPLKGRSFTAADEVTDNTSVIVSHSFWQNRLAADPSVIGRVMNVDGTPRTIIGVMPEGFAPLLISSDVYSPLALDAGQMQNSWRGVMSVGRVRPGVALPTATADLDRMNGQIGDLIPSARGVHIRLRPVREVLFGGDRGSLSVTLAAVVLLLVLAIANVASLALSDALARRQGTMTRLAFGASPWSIAGRRLGEGAVMAVVSAALGLGLARVTLTVLQSANPDFFQGYGPLAANARLVVAASLIALLASLIAFLPVAVSEARTSVTSLATTESRGIGGRRERWIRDSLLASQVAIALVLLFAATLLAKNLRSMMQTERGFRASRLMAIKFAIPPRYSTPNLRSDYLQQLIDAMAQVPGVSSVSASQVAFSPGFTSKSTLAIEGAPQGPGNGLISNIRHVMPRAMEVMGIKLLSGRGFEVTDRENGPPVAIVSGSFARQFLPPDHVMGARLRRTAIPGAPWMEVVGVVDEVKDAGVSEELGPTIYVPYRQDNQTTVFMTLLARLSSDVPPSERVIKNALWQVDRSQAISRIALVTDLAYESAAAPRFRALVVALLGVAALILVAGGIYALTLFNVLKRTREIGLRAALGADSRTLIEGAVWMGLRPVALGMIVGLVAALPAVQVMQRVVKETLSANDLPLLVAVLAGLLVSGALCALIPALRATRISPIVALRD